MEDVVRMLPQLKKQTRWSGNTLKVRPYIYQREAARLARQKGRFGLWMEQGTGKTLVALKVAAYYWKNNLVDSVLVLGPKAVLSVWEDEISKFLRIPYTINAQKPQKNSLNFTLINYERLKKYRKKKDRGKFDLVIADESHRIKSRNSIQSRVSAKFSEESKFALALSGTPRGNDDIDFFAQYRFINPKIFGTWKEFDKEYLKPCGYMGYDRKFRPLKLKQFQSLVQANSFRITKSECLDLPPITETVIKVELKNRKPYDKMVKDLLLRFKDKEDIITIEANLAVTLVSKLQQLASGFIYDQDHNIIPTDNSKLTVLDDLISHDRKTIIFVKYTYEVDLIKKYLEKEYKVLTYDGRTEDKSCWREMDKYDVMVAQIKSGGTGLNLQMASVVIFYSMTFSFIDISQARDRVYRNGQKEKVSIYYLLSKDTVEENIYKRVMAKQDDAKLILDDIRMAQKAAIRDE